jgi:NADH:ubiquinone oxidoreductase subunit E
MKKLFVCTNYRSNPNNPSCGARGSQSLLSALAQQCAQNNLAIQVEESLCLGFCQVGPNARLAPNGPFFHAMSPDGLSAIIEAAKQFNNGQV